MTPKWSTADEGATPLTRLVRIGGGYTIRKCKPIALPEGECEGIVEVPPPVMAPRGRSQ